MPQLVPRGKHVFGWSEIDGGGSIRIPPKAMEEYVFSQGERVILLPGSRTSGGFGLATRRSVSGSSFIAATSQGADFLQWSTQEGEVFLHGGRPYCWTTIGDGCIALPEVSLKKFGTGPGNRLLVIRGSGLALGFATRGPIVEEAVRHPELEVFRPGDQA